MKSSRRSSRSRQSDAIGTAGHSADIAGHFSSREATQERYPRIGMKTLSTRPPSTPVNSTKQTLIDPMSAIHRGFFLLGPNRKILGYFSNSIFSTFSKVQASRRRKSWKVEKFRLGTSKKFKSSKVEMGHLQKVQKFKSWDGTPPKSSKVQKVQK